MSIKRGKRLRSGGPVGEEVWEGAFKRGWFLQVHHYTTKGAKDPDLVKNYFSQFHFSYIDVNPLLFCEIPWLLNHSVSFSAPHLFSFLESVCRNQYKQIESKIMSRTIKLGSCGNYSAYVKWLNNTVRYEILIYTSSRKYLFMYIYTQQA